MGRRLSGVPACPLRPFARDRRAKSTCGDGWQGINRRAPRRRRAGAPIGFSPPLSLARAIAGAARCAPAGPPTPRPERGGRSCARPAARSARLGPRVPRARRVAPRAPPPPPPLPPLPPRQAGPPNRDRARSPVWFPAYQHPQRRHQNAFNKAHQIACGGAADSGPLPAPLFFFWLSE